MQTPPCPACGTPLRWFPEMNAWGCDRCRQMMPASAPPMHGMQGPPGRRTQAEKTRTMILAGALVVAIIGVGIMLATDDKGSEEGEAPDVAATAEPSDVEAEAPARPTAPPTTPPATAPATPPATTPAPASATTPKGARIDIPECAEVAALRRRVEACAAVPENIRTILYQDADNKMSAFDTGPPSGDFAEMLRGKCAGTAKSLAESLARYSCK